MATSIAELREQLADISKGLDGLNDAPTGDASKSVGKDEGTPAPTSAEARIKQVELRDKVAAMPMAKITELLGLQADIEAGKQADAGFLQQAAVATPGLQKLLDTSGGAALVRQDLDPFLYALLVKKFPLWERLRKEPSNGKVHAYNQITAVGAAQYTAETTAATDDNATYNQVTTNISVLTTRRGVSLKEQFAVAQGGAGYNALGSELSAGVTAITKQVQQTIVRGNATTAGKTNADEEGAYDANSFTGLRFLLGTPNAANNPVVLDKGANSYMSAFNQVVGSALDNGGTPSAIYMSPTRYADWQNEQLSILRAGPGQAGGQGNNYTSVVTAAGELPIITIPGGAFSTYTKTASGREDIYVVDEEYITVPYLGADSITTIEIPVGVNGSLTRLYIMFLMVGLAVKAPLFMAKVRI